MNRVDLTIDHLGPEVWSVTNGNSDWPHNFHIHNARFKVVSIDGADTDAVMTSGWKDTVAIPPGATAELAVEFGWYPDPTMPYMYHCHMLLHEGPGHDGPVRHRRTRWGSEYPGDGGPRPLGDRDRLLPTFSHIGERRPGVSVRLRPRKRSGRDQPVART